jgi:hypothetical protein
MAVPTAYPIALYIAGSDRTADVHFDSLRLDDKRTSVSTLKFVVRNPSGYTPTRFDEVNLYTSDLETTIFSGLITDRARNFRGVETDYEITASDQKVRLQKAVLDPKIYTGTDAEILAEMLEDAYPDLSDIFDFDTNVAGTLEDMTFEVGDTNLLDALNDLADVTGAEMSVDPGEVKGSNDIVFTFDTGGPSNYTITPNGVSPLNLSVTAGQGVDDGDGPSSAPYGTTNADGIFSDDIVLGPWTFADNIEIDNLTLSFAWNASNTPEVYTQELRFEITIRTWLDVATDTTVYNATTAFSPAYMPESAFNHQPSNNSTYRTFSIDTGVLFNLPAGTFGNYGPIKDITINVEVTTAAEDTTSSIAVDNITLVNAYQNVEGSGGPTPEVPPDPALNWGDTAIDAPFDFDLESGDEFLYDLEFEDADFDFNALIIAGGKRSEDVDWTYESDGDMDHINLEVPIRDYTIYVNDGTDGTPSWTAQTAGTLGTDKLTSQGGDKDVLYDPNYHWLWFNTNPPNLSKSVRVEGTIEIPIRILVDGSEDGDPVFAGVIYDESVTSEDEAIQRAQSELDKRNAPKRAYWKTHEPGLRPGMEIDVTDSSRSISETVIIQRVTAHWLGGSGHAEFNIEAGPSEFPSADVLIAENDRRSRGSSPPGTVSATVALLTDDSGNPLFDDNGNYLYEVQ